MDITEYTIRNKTITWMVIILLILGGILSFTKLGRLEDPNFTIKQAMIFVSYPGASALEVEEELTLPLENALQQLSALDKITSTSSVGLSQIMVEMKSTYRKQQLAQIWDEMRRKINDLRPMLPPGVKEPQIIDQFGDVYGMFLSITGNGYGYDELADYADFLRRELVLVDGVSKVNIGGRRQEQIVIEIDRAKLTASGLALNDISRLLSTQNLVSDAGKIKVGSEYIRISSKTETTNGVAQLSNLLVGTINGQLVYLQDIARISQAYAEPAKHLYHFNGKSSLMLGVSFSTGVNVVDVGNLVRTRLRELETERPVGMIINTVYDQPEQVEISVNNFIVSLLQAVLIVVVVLVIMKNNHLINP